MCFQALGCFLAWSARTSGQRLPLAMVAVTAFSVSGATGSLLTSHDPPLHFCVTGVLILCCNAFTLSWLSAPKVSRSRVLTSPPVPIPRWPRGARPESCSVGD